MKAILVSGIAALAFATAAPAATIQGLFNTGTDGNNVALAGGAGVVDTHYSILSSTSPGFAGQQAVTFNCCYVADDADSRWVSLSGSGSAGTRAPGGRSAERARRTAAAGIPGRGLLLAVIARIDTRPCLLGGGHRCRRRHGRRCYGPANARPG